MWFGDKMTDSIAGATLGLKENVMQFQKILLKVMKILTYNFILLVQILFGIKDLWRSIYGKALFLLQV